MLVITNPIEDQKLLEQDDSPSNLGMAFSQLILLDFHALVLQPSISVLGKIPDNIKCTKIQDITIIANTPESLRNLEILEISRFSHLISPG